MSLAIKLPEKLDVDPDELNIDHQNFNFLFDGECIRKKSNWSKNDVAMKFDTPKFNPETLRNEIPMRSPKLHKLLQNIRALDARDMAKDGRLYKHFIFSDLKSGTNGAKLLASAMAASGYTLAYSVKKEIPDDQLSDDEWGENDDDDDEEDAALPLRLKGPIPEVTVIPERRPRVNRLEQDRKRLQNMERALTREEILALGKDEFDHRKEVFENPPRRRGVNREKLAKIDDFIQQKKNKFTQIRNDFEKRAKEDAVAKRKLELDLLNYYNDERRAKNAQTRRIVQPQKRGGAGAYPKIRLKTDKLLRKTAYQNFVLLSSVSVYDQEITVALKKEILRKYNQRPDNVYGSLIRFIVMDSGYKEGLDLFDVKYIHIFEPQTTMADQKQVIGRGTRTCGQNGLLFQPTKGWPLYVFNYDLALTLDGKTQREFNDATTAFEFYLKSINVDLRLVNLTSAIEETAILSAVDYELNRNIHTFRLPDDADDDEEAAAAAENALAVVGGANTPPVQPPPPPPRLLTFQEMRDYIRTYYLKNYSWDAVTLVNNCGYTGPKLNRQRQPVMRPPPQHVVQQGGGIMKLQPTQNFVRTYFTPANPVKGILLWHSVGTGKTCSAIAATAAFENQEYTILWVTRTTLKSDVDKNIFDQICHERIRQYVEAGNEVPKDSDLRRKLLSKSWKIRPMSYKQFSNLVSKANSFYEDLVRINGTDDPLRKTLIVIDEAHKLYGGNDLSSIERPDMNALYQSIMHSYVYSKQDSVRLLLMTATPITVDPFELVKLVNLFKMPGDRLADTYDTFAPTYLNDEGRFTGQGEKRFLDDMTGYISFLNRERDARQFSQPILKQVHVPIANAEMMRQIEKYDKTTQAVRNLTEEDQQVIQLQEQLDAQNAKLAGDLGGITAKMFDPLIDEKCQRFDGNNKTKKQCHSIVKKLVAELVHELKADVQHIKAELKTIQAQIQEIKRHKKGEIKAQKLQNEADYKDYQASMFYTLKYECSKKVKDTSALQTYVNNHPTVVAAESMVKQLDQKMADYRIQLDAYKTKIVQMNTQLKTFRGEAKERFRADIQRETNAYETESAKYAQELKDRNQYAQYLETMKKRYLTQLDKWVQSKIKEVAKEAKKEEKKNKTLKKQLGKSEKVQANLAEIRDEGLKAKINAASAKIEHAIRDLGKTAEQIQEERDHERLYARLNTMNAMYQELEAKMEEENQNFAERQRGLDQQYEERRAKLQKYYQTFAVKYDDLKNQLKSRKDDFTMQAKLIQQKRELEEDRNNTENNIQHELKIIARQKEDLKQSKNKSIKTIEMDMKDLESAIRQERTNIQYQEEAIRHAKFKKEADERAAKEQALLQKQAEIEQAKAQKEAQKEAEKAQKEAQKEAQKAQKEAQKEALKGQKEAEKARLKAEKEAQKQAEMAAKLAEKERIKTLKAEEKAQKQAEKALNHSIKRTKMPATKRATRKNVTEES